MAADSDFVAAIAARFPNVKRTAIFIPAAGFRQQSKLRYVLIVAEVDFFGLFAVFVRRFVFDIGIV